jgi:hypothetical protein
MQINSEGKSIDKWKLHLKLGTEKKIKRWRNSEEKSNEKMEG